jgi:hypothetical protein
LVSALTRPRGIEGSSYLLSGAADGKVHM